MECKHEGILTFREMCLPSVPSRCADLRLFVPQVSIICGKLDIIRTITCQECQHLGETSSERDVTRRKEAIGTVPLSPLHMKRYKKGATLQPKGSENSMLPLRCMRFSSETTAAFRARGRARTRSARLLCAVLRYRVCVSVTSGTSARLSAAVLVSSSSIAAPARTLRPLSANRTWHLSCCPCCSGGTE